MTRKFLRRGRALSESVEDLMAKLNVNSKTMARTLSDDILHDIFMLALPTSSPSPVADSASAFIASTVPYSISRVCRSWRILVLSSPLLWSSFFFSFSNPSDKTLVLLFRFVKQHLVRSRKLPLTAFIRLEGAYNYSLSKVIVALLSSRQSRWKRVGIWFETEAGKDVIPIPKMQLFVEAITLLEELQISFSTEYIITSSTGRSLRNALPFAHTPRPTYSLRVPRGNALARPRPQPQGVEYQTRSQLYQRLHTAPFIPAIVRARGCNSQNSHDAPARYQSDRKVLALRRRHAKTHVVSSTDRPSSGCWNFRQPHYQQCTPLSMWVPPTRQTQYSGIRPSWHFRLVD